jgi:hypothetical protein
MAVTEIVEITNQVRLYSIKDPLTNLEATARFVKLFLMTERRKLFLLLSLCLSFVTVHTFSLPSFILLMTLFIETKDAP